jgi:hypothetical protein
MKLKSIFLFTFLSLVLGACLLGCNKEAKSKSSAVAPVSGNSMSSSDDFSDLEKQKKDESCDTAEDLEKKIVEKAKKQEAFKLQGGDPGCATD